MNNENSTSTPPGLTQPGSTSQTATYEASAELHGKCTATTRELFLALEDIAELVEANLVTHEVADSAWNEELNKALAALASVRGEVENANPTYARHAARVRRLLDFLSRGLDVQDRLATRGISNNQKQRIFEELLLVEGILIKTAAQASATFATDIIDWLDRSERKERHAKRAASAGKEGK